MKAKKRWMAAVAACCVCATLFGCGQKDSTAQESASTASAEEETVTSVYSLWVDGEEVKVDGYLIDTGKYGVTLDEYRYYYMSLRATQEAGKTEEEIAELWTAEMQQALKDQATGYALSAMALRRMADVYSIQLTDEDEEGYQAELAKQKEAYGDNFQTEFLEANYYTEEVFRELYYDTVRYQKIYEYLYGEYGENAFDEDTLLEYYEDYYFRVKQIVIPIDTDGNSTNYDTAVSVRAAIINGADFEEMQAQYNTDPDADSYPDGYTMVYNDMPDEMQNAVSDLIIGEVAGLYSDDENYYIVKRYDLLDEYFEENYDDIYASAAETDFNAKRKDLMYLLYDSVTYQEAYTQITVETLN